MSRTQSFSPRARVADGLQAFVASALLEDVARDGLIIVDSQWRVLAHSPPAAERLNWAVPPTGRSFWEAVEGQFDPTACARARKSLSLGHSAELLPRAPNATRTYLRLVPCGVGAVIMVRRVGAAMRNRLAQREARRRLQELNESLRFAHRAARGATWEWRRGDVLRWTDVEAARALLGLPESHEPDPIVGDWWQYVLEDDRDAVARAVDSLVATGQGRTEFRIRTPEGVVKWLEANALVAERDEAGDPTRLAGVTIDISDRKAADEALRREVAERRSAEERQRLLVMELNHRVKNTLATVQSIARQTLRRTPDWRPVFDDFEARLMALSWAHDVLTGQGWSGADLTEIITRTVRPHQSQSGAKIEISGPSAHLPPQTSLALAMALHELATNALKHGALKREGGRVVISWDLAGVDGRTGLRLVWTERGGPPVTPPKRIGFGTRLLTQGLAADLGAPVELRFEPDGLVCVLQVPLAQASPEPPGDVSAGAPQKEPAA